MNKNVWYRISFISFKILVFEIVTKVDFTYTKSNSVEFLEAVWTSGDIKCRLKEVSVVLIGIIQTQAYMFGE